MADVQALCKRVIVIDHGEILYDGALRALSTRYSPHQTINVTLTEPDEDLGAYGEVVSSDNGRISLKVAKDDTSAVAARLLAAFQVTDLTSEDPPIEEVIEQVFAGSDLSGTVVAVATALVVLALVFSHTDSLGGWSSDELLVIMGVYV